jgi:hypothetical protein
MYENLTEDRISALFSALNKENRIATKEKIEFWTGQIQQFLSSKKTFTFSTLDFDSQFAHNGMTPLCLEAIVVELIENKTIGRKESPSFLTSLSSWFLGDSSQTDIFQKDNKYIFQPLLNLIKTKLIERVEKESIGLMTKSEFLGLCGQVGLSEISDIEDLTKILENEKFILTCESVKLGTTLYRWKQNNQLLPIDDHDISLLLLQKTVKDLEDQIDQLTRNIEE